MNRIVIMGGGPAGYEAALVAAQHGAEVTVVERDGMGGACVLDDCVPSKTLISSAGIRTELRRAGELGIEADEHSARVDLVGINRRVLSLARAQSADVRTRMQGEGVRLLAGTAQFSTDTSWATPAAPHHVTATLADGGQEELPADVVLLATGATPRVLPDAVPDGER